MTQVKFAKPQLGPIIGHCTVEEKDGETTSSTTIWVRFESSGKGLIAYREKDTDQALFQTFELISTLGNVGIVKLTKLKPNTKYQYKIGLLNGEDQQWDNFENDIIRYFKTFADQPEKTTFIFGSCRHYGNMFPRQGDTSLKQIYKKDMHNADFIIMGGDQVYVDYPTKYLGSYNPWKINNPPKKIEGFLENYRIYYDQTGFRNTTASLPCYMIWDDHEVQNNWSKAAFFDDKNVKYEKKTYLNGLKSYMGHQALFSPVLEDNVNNSGLKSDLYNLQGSELDNRLEEVKYYYQMQHGNSAFFFMDVRGERTSISEGDMISEKQIVNLEKFLDDNPEKIKFIVSPTPFFPDFVNEKVLGRATKLDMIAGFASPDDIWTGYAEQREKIIKKIITIAKKYDKQHEGQYVLPVFLGGDVHVGLKAQLQCSHSEDELIILHSIISSAFNWYIFGVQGLTARSGERLYNKWSNDEKDRKKGNMFCEVDKIKIKGRSTEKVINGNNYAVIEADNEGIKVAFQLTGILRREAEPLVISKDELKIQYFKQS